MSDRSLHWRGGIICTLAIALGPMISIAEPTPADAVTSIGTGMASCGAWTANRTANGVAARQDEQWVAGYLSAAAVFSTH